MSLGMRAPSFLRQFSLAPIKASAWQRASSSAFWGCRASTCLRQGKEGWCLAVDDAAAACALPRAVPRSAQWHVDAIKVRPFMQAL